MATLSAAIVETRGNPAFWEIARRYGIIPSGTEVAPYVLLVCDSGPFGRALPSFAEALSRDTGGKVLAFLAQTTADTHQIDDFENGVLVRRLIYSRDHGGWSTLQGEVQAWERAYFFGDAFGTGDGEAWPDMLGDELSDEDIARYEGARASGDPSTVTDLLHPGSTAPIGRVCRSFGVDAGAPSGSWRAPRSPWPWVIGGLVVAFLAGMFLLGALT